MIAMHPNPCTHADQDRMYGKGYRVMNPVKVDPKQPLAYRCTVCSPPKMKGVKRGGIFQLSDLKVLRG